ncbi:hypothetical protein BDE40_0752 [Litoreibacter halocynthiae]|uniref:Uncharacterized protein n=2 Tax=Litoreibacter TaxID=947567 RepID=A0A4V3EWM6_9RHOB|nr:hypothetical protein [Litoreibacter]RLJ41480.1 hypothetical protein BCF46_2439 [Litoreibacter meonggei]TDT77465.1 hypothetical protein BDE40_0752 [Litoreibacter halocynthiae]
MSDYTTHNEGVGTTGLVVAAVLIGLFIIVLAMLGSGSVTEGETMVAPESLDAPAVTAPATTVPADGG